MSVIYRKEYRIDEFIQQNNINKNNYIEFFELYKILYFSDYIDIKEEFIYYRDLVFHFDT